jgi:hypothetical protein
MRVLVRTTTDHELILDEDGRDSNGFYFNDILDTLADDTADSYEKTRTIVVLMSNNEATTNVVRTQYNVFIFDDNGALIFTGSL